MKFSVGRQCFWRPPSLVFNGYWDLFPRGYSEWCTRLITQLRSVLRSRMGGACHPSLIALHGRLYRTRRTLSSPWLEPEESSSHKASGTAVTLNERIKKRKIKLLRYGGRDFLTPIRFVVHHIRDNEVASDGCWRLLQPHRAILTHSGHRDLLRFSG